MLDNKAPNGVSYSRLNFVERGASYNMAPSSDSIRPPERPPAKQEGLPLKHRFYGVEYSNAFSFPELPWEMSSRKPFDPMDTKYYNSLEAGVKKFVLPSGKTIDRASIRGMPIIKG